VADLVGTGEPFTVRVVLGVEKDRGVLPTLLYQRAGHARIEVRVQDIDTECRGDEHRVDGIAVSPHGLAEPVSVTGSVNCGL
jgi:hypothetical protein